MIFFHVTSNSTPRRMKELYELFVEDILDDFQTNVSDWHQLSGSEKEVLKMAAQEEAKIFLKEVVHRRRKEKK